MISNESRRNQSRSINGHGIDAPMGHPRPGNGGRSTPGPTTIDRRRGFDLDRCNGHGLKVRPPDREARRACSACTAQHDLAPPHRRHGRSSARGPSIDLMREPDAATSVSDGAADAHLSRRDEVRAVYDGPDWVEGGLVDSSHNGPGDRTAGHRASKYLPSGHTPRRRSRTHARRRAIGVDERPWFASYFLFLFRCYLKSDLIT